MEELPLHLKMKIMAMLDGGKGLSVKNSSSSTEIDLLSHLDVSMLNFFTVEEIHSLQKEGYIVKDGFLGKDVALKIRKECEDLYKEGLLKPGGMGRDGKWNETTLRGDSMAWLELDEDETELHSEAKTHRETAKDKGEENDHRVKEETATETKKEMEEEREKDGKVKVGVTQQGQALRRVGRELAQLGLELRRATQVGSPGKNGNGVKVTLQLASFPPEKGYTRHVDSFPGGPNRLFTFIYYLNPHWEPSHGGCLRLYLPTGPKDISPIADRLLVFLSPFVEHEVLLSHQSSRLALTMWMY